MNLSRLAPLSIAAGLSLSAWAGPVLAEPNILIIMDASNSMWGQLDGEAKIGTARSALAELIQQMPEGASLGLMAYGHRNKSDCKDVELVTPIGAAAPTDVIDAVTAISPRGKTLIAESLKQSEAAFEGIREEDNHIVLISDGIETCEGDPCAVAAELQKKGINVRVHVVGFDVKDEAVMQLQCIADAGNGRFFQASDTLAFRDAIKEVEKVVAEPVAPRKPAGKVTMREPEPPPPEPAVIFEDEFDGDVLGEHWAVENPDPDSYIVEDGRLLTVYQDEGRFSNMEVANFFRLAADLPKGDWRATIRVEMEYQTLREDLIFGLYESPTDYMLADTFVRSWCCYARNITLSGTKNSGGTPTSFAEGLSPEIDLGQGNFDAYREAFQEIGSALQVRLTKTGRNYVFSGRPEGTDANGKAFPWVELEKLTSLRQKGDLVFGFKQMKSGSGHSSSGGESLAFVDWVRIEAIN